MYKLHPPTPRYDSTWDPDIVLSYLKTLYPNSLSLELLTKKLVMLLALSSGQRVQILAKISLNNLVKFEDRIEIKISERIKTSGKNKFQPILSLPFIKECPKLCVASVLECYLIQTHSTQTISRRLKEILKKSGINTDIFCGHSTRHAATSAAFRSESV
nr:unnamed protein product [Callosobruchus analis]